MGTVGRVQRDAVVAQVDSQPVIGEDAVAVDHVADGAAVDDLNARASYRRVGGVEGDRVAQHDVVRRTGAQDDATTAVSHGGEAVGPQPDEVALDQVPAYAPDVNASGQDVVAVAEIA